MAVRLVEGRLVRVWSGLVTDCYWDGGLNCGELPLGRLSCWCRRGNCGLGGRSYTSFLGWSGHGNLIVEARRLLGIGGRRGRTNRLGWLGSYYLSVKRKSNTELVNGHFGVLYGTGGLCALLTGGDDNQARTGRRQS